MLLLALRAASVEAQNIPTIRGGISLVYVDAQVLAGDGRIVAGLSKDDFRVFDEGIEQPLVAFEQEEQPLDLILLFDVSGSMHQSVEKVAAAGDRALRELRSGDRVSVMTFGSDVYHIAPFTDDHSVIESALSRVLKSPFNERTYIQEAVYCAARDFINLHDGDRRRRRAVLIITDNLGARTRSERSVVEEFWEANAILTGLIVPNHLALGGLLASAHIHFPGGIDHIVEQSGGEEIRSDDLGSAFTEMMHRIRSRYSLYYRLPEGTPGARRRIGVELSAEAKKRFPEGHVEARRGYRLPARDQHVFDMR